MEIIQPRNAKELAKIVKSLGIKSIRLDSSANKGVVSLDKDSLTVTVKTGSTWSELETYLKTVDYDLCIYPKDNTITINEWLQTDGINLAGFKLGPSGRSIYDIEIVTFRGEVTNLGFKTTLYDALGYELKRFFLGSQNTLGITTECILQFRSAPESKRAIQIKLAPDFSIPDLIGKFNKKSLIPTLMFFTQSENQPISLYILFDGSQKIVDAQVDVLNSIVSSFSGIVYNEITSDELIVALYAKTDNVTTYYMIAPSKFSEFLATFRLFSKAYLINRNTLLVALNLNKLGMDEPNANSKVLELKGKKAYIDPSKIEELKMFGDELTPDLIQRIRKAFDPDGALTEVPKKKAKLAIMPEVKQPETIIEKPPEPTVEKPPEPTVEKPPEPTIEKPPEPTVEKPPEPTIEKPPEPTIEKPPEEKEETDVWKKLADETKGE